MKRIYSNTEYGQFIVNREDEIIVDSEIQWSIEFISKITFSEYSHIKIVVPAYQHQRSEEYLQCYDYWKSNYIYCVGEEDDISCDVSIHRINTDFTHIKNWPDSLRVAIITFKNGLKSGDKINIFFGGIDRLWLERHCYPSRVSQFASKVDENLLYYKVYVDFDATEKYKEVEIFPPIKILPDKPSNLFIYTKNIVNVDEKFKIKYLITDRFHNPIFNYDLEKIKCKIIELKTNKQKEYNINELISFEYEGFYLVTCENTNLNVVESIVLCTSDNINILWGDAHTHSNLTANIRDNDCGATLESMYKYAKMVSNLDFIAITEQTFAFDNNKRLNITKEVWKKMAHECDQYNEVGVLTTFAGCEIHDKRGDTVIIYKNSLTEYEYPENVNNIYDLWEFFEDKEFLSIPHLHRYCNARAFKDQQDEKYGGFQLENWKIENQNEVLCEIYSSQWGRFEHQNHPMVLKARANVKGNSVSEFLCRGKKWGIVANSDGHDGTPGYGGITGVFASKNTRDDVFKALKNRKTIASTGTRAVILFKMNENEIGDVINNCENVFASLVILSPKKIKKIEVIKNGEIFKVYNCSNLFFETQFEDNNLMENNFYYIRVKLENRELIWCSPIWVNKKQS